MGSTEESKKPISLYNSSSSTPLLSKPIYPSPVEHPPSLPSPSHNEPPESYVSRPFKDLSFLILFLLFVISTFSFGIFSIFHRNINYSNLASYAYDSSSSSCVKHSLSSSANWVFSLSSSSSSHLLKDLIWTLVVTLILSFPICFALLLLLKHYTKQIVYITLPFFIVIPIFFNIYWFVACTVSSSCSDVFPLAYRILVLVFLFLVIGIIMWIFVANCHRIELTVSVIGVSSDALSRNLGLFGALPCMTLGLLVYYAPIVVFMVCAWFNGKIVPRESNGEYTCVWKQDSWVPAYFALAILTMLWSATTMVEAQVYVISGTIAQWYFTKADSTPKRSIRSSLSARQEDVPGVVSLILCYCVNACLSGVEFLNKFTINFAAITGEAYCTSARMTYEVLKQNLLSAVFVETISTRLLAGIICVLSTIYAIVVCVIVKSDLGVDSYSVAALAWLLLILVLGFFVHVLDNVIDTIYVCYAIDKDRGEVCKQDVHEVYIHLPISINHRPASLIRRTLGV